jgi:hypothetical protein
MMVSKWAQDSNHWSDSGASLDLVFFHHMGMKVAITNYNVLCREYQPAQVLRTLLTSVPTVRSSYVE